MSTLEFHVRRCSIIIVITDSLADLRKIIWIAAIRPQLYLCLTRRCISPVCVNHGLLPWSPPRRVQEWYTATRSEDQAAVLQAGACIKADPSIVDKKDEAG